MPEQRLSRTLSRFHCPVCWSISADSSMLQTNNPCPVCGSKGQVRLSYPSISAKRLIDMIQHFYIIAAHQREDGISKMSNKISEILERPCSNKATYHGLLNKINKTKSFDLALKQVERFFRCDQSKSMSILQAYLSTDFATPDETVVIPVLTIMLIETLLNELLKDLKVKRCGVTVKCALKEIEKLRSFYDRFALFFKITGEEWEKQVQEISKPFWDNWEPVRCQRNYFVHGNPYAIGWDTCERAFKLTKDSVSVFSALNNKFIIVNKSSI